MCMCIYIREVWFIYVLDIDQTGWYRWLLWKPTPTRDTCFPPQPNRADVNADRGTVTTCDQSASVNTQGRRWTCRLGAITWRNWCYVNWTLSIRAWPLWNIIPAMPLYSVGYSYPGICVLVTCKEISIIYTYIYFICKCCRFVYCTFSTAIELFLAAYPVRFPDRTYINQFMREICLFTIISSQNIDNVISPEAVHPSIHSFFHSFIHEYNTLWMRLQVYWFVRFPLFHSLLLLSTTHPTFTITKITVYSRLLTSNSALFV